MAKNLIKAGYPLLVHNRTREKEQPLLELGAVSAEDAAGAARDTDVVITMLGDAPDVKEILFGAEGSFRLQSLGMSSST